MNQTTKRPKFEARGKGVDLSSLDQFKPEYFLDQKLTSFNTSGQLMMVALHKLHEDPKNSRREFDKDKLQELVDSIKAINPSTGEPRGIKNPLSVKTHPEKKGEYFINAGHRRFRAAAICGLSEVPAFLDDETDETDNAVDNIQREGLSPLEIAHFIKGRIDAGDKKKDIAEQLGKVQAFVSNHLIFFDMAVCVRDLYDSGSCRSMKALALLHRAGKKHSEDVAKFCANVKGEVSTTQVQKFCDSLKTQEQPQEPTSTEANGTTPDQTSDNLHIDKSENKIQTINIQVLHAERIAYLNSIRKAAVGSGWVKYEDDASEAEVVLDEINFMAFISK